MNQLFLQIYDAEYRDRLSVAPPWIRAETFRAIFAALPNKPIYIVETGTTWSVDNWHGDGCSTVMFDRYCQVTGSQLWTIDIADRKELHTNLKHTTIITGNSIDVLADWKLPIDLLYLDTADDRTGAHQLNELAAAMHCLKIGSVVAVDDVPYKSSKVVEYMKLLGNAEEIVMGYQAAWRLA